ncbi:hypothetical protein CLV44_12338 [Marinobacterium halophilum]|uniref:7TM protein involved in diverse intracellular signaling n=1 Tax=Marinobacterium halophilum TaxID=267374 RepID=A0A2P8EQH1_9GAMM|nr:hypothetical protein [Marinobacterium halophilum]PSL11720.1 hypothetical protein CLV44_12338 [Marinobacterium halophilum]
MQVNRASSILGALFLQACMLLLLLGIASAVQASVAVTLEEGVSRYTVPDRNVWHRLVEPLDDPSHLALLDAFERSRAAEASLVGQRGPVIARLELSHVGQANEQWYLLFNANYIDQGVAYWKPEAGPPVALEEFSQLNDERTPRLLHYQAISLPLVPGDRGEILIYVNARHYADPFAIELMNQNDFVQYQFVVNSGSIAAISVMMTLTLLALILFWRTRYWVTLACAGYIGLHALGWAASSGLLDDLFDWTRWNTTYAGMLLFPFAIACASQFTRLLFNDHKNHHRIALYLNLLSMSTLYAHKQGKQRARREMLTHVS